MIFSTQKHPVKPINTDLIMSNQSIELVTSFGYYFFGVLHWMNILNGINILIQSLTKISKEISKNIGILQKLRATVDQQTLIKLYNTFIHSYLTNGIISRREDGLSCRHGVKPPLTHSLTLLLTPLFFAGRYSEAADPEPSSQAMYCQQQAD